MFSRRGKGLYFLGGKSCDAFVQPAFIFLDGKSSKKHVTWPLSSRSKHGLPLQTCFQLFHSIRKHKDFATVVLSFYKRETVSKKLLWQQTKAEFNLFAYKMDFRAAYLPISFNL